MSPSPRRTAVPIALSFLLGLPACNLARFEATRERTLQEPAAGLTALTCTSHNGQIEFIGTKGSEAVRVRAHLGAAGETQADADAYVQEIDVAVERRAAELVIASVVPPELEGVRAWFRITIEAPPHLALRFDTHNGGVDVRHGTGQLAVTTHNGCITAATAAAAVDLETHNGEIDLVLDGDGPVQGEVTSHNGTVEVNLGARAAVVDASTHNGSIRTDASLQVQPRGENAVRVVAGRDGGVLTVVTHNGGVTIH